MQYSNRALIALSYLFRPYNDIDIYIEDTTCQNMYQVLIERILDGQARLRRVFSLGGRSEVIKRCSADQRDTDRKRLYLIDGDFDALLGNQVAPHLKRLYQLKVYCAENILFCEHAANELGCECLTDAPKSVIKTLVDFGSFSSSLVSILKPLLILYGAARILDDSLQTSSFNVTRLVEDRGGLVELSRTKTKERFRSLLSELRSAHSVYDVRATMKKVRSRLPTQHDKVIGLVPGKTYLLPLLGLRLRHRVKFKEDLDRLKVRLARHCMLDKDPGLIRAVHRTSRGQRL